MTLTYDYNSMGDRSSMTDSLGSVGITTYQYDNAAGWHCWHFLRVPLALPVSLFHDGSLHHLGYHQRAMHRKTVKHFHVHGHLHELTFSCYRRLSLLLDDERCRILARAIDVANREQAVRLYAFAFMPESKSRCQFTKVGVSKSRCQFIFPCASRTSHAASQCQREPWTQ